MWQELGPYAKHTVDRGQIREYLLLQGRSLSLHRDSVPHVRRPVIVLLQMCC